MGNLWECFSLQNVFWHALQIKVQCQKRVLPKNKDLFVVSFLWAVASGMTEFVFCLQYWKCAFQQKPKQSKEHKIFLAYSKPMSVPDSTGSATQLTHNLSQQHSWPTQLPSTWLTYLGAQQQWVSKDPFGSLAAMGQQHSWHTWPTQFPNTMGQQHGWAISVPSIPMPQKSASEK